MKRIGFIYGLLFCLILSVAAQEKVVSEAENCTDK